MKQIEIWIEKNRKKMWFSILLNFLILMLLVVICRPCYETNDDTSIAMIVNGARGSRDARVICQNYLLGLLYKGLYSLCGISVPWYAVLQYLFLMVSFSAITYVLFQKWEKWQPVMMTGILLVFFGYECYIKVQYTKTAGILMAAGTFLMYYAVEQVKLSKRALFFGMMLCFVGGLYRFEEALICFVLMSGIGLFLLFQLPELEQNQRKKRFIMYLISFLVMLMLLGGAEILDRYVYASDPEWDYYMKYNDLRCDIMDYGVASFADHEAEYKELGIDKSAYKIFRSGYSFYDPDVFTMEVLEKIVAMRERRSLNKALIRDFFKEYPIGFLGIYTFYAFLIAAAGWLFWGKKNWKTILIALYEIILMGSFDLYLFYTGRYLENRVETGLWIAITLVVFWLYDQEKMKVNREYVYVFLMSILIVNLGEIQERFRFSEKVRQEEADRLYQRESFLEATQEKDALYLAKLGTVTYTSYGIFDIVPEGIFENVVWYGGWEMANPNWVHTMEKFQVRSPYGDTIDRDNVFIIDNNIDLTENYIKKHYNKKIEAENVKEAGYLQVYRIVSK